MATLYLLRHAKSSWADESMGDFDRPLADRGREDCAVIGAYIEEKGIDFDLVLVSTAVRTRETIALVKDRAQFGVEVRFDDRIYEATTSQLLEVISEVDDDRESVLLVGHNPGIEELLALLTGEHPDVSTATFAKIKINAPKWSANLGNNGTLDWIVRPKELQES
ncbi:MAG TPA: histidine phosphatase family protein [Pyrinomonadaceae bacterium]|nr:histidine phosphatase family protein [Pyrinomonadaceae bacterium]